MTGPIDDYVTAAPEAARAHLADLVALVRAELPGAGEKLAYGMPTFTREGRAVVHVAGWAKHVSVYPFPGEDEDLARDAAAYLSGASTLKLPLSEPLPLDLLARVVRALAAR